MYIFTADNLKTIELEHPLCAGRMPGCLLLFYIFYITK